MTIIVPPCVFCKRFPCELQRYCKYMYVTFCSAVDPDLEISKDSFNEIIRLVNSIGLEKLIELYNKRLQKFLRFFDEHVSLKEQTVKGGVRK